MTPWNSDSPGDSPWPDEPRAESSRHSDGRPATRSSPNLAVELSRRSDRIVSLILFSDLPWIDIALEIQQMRDLVEEFDPDRVDAFERIYTARFQRIRDQWRED